VQVGSSKPLYSLSPGVLDYYYPRIVLFAHPVFSLPPSALWPFPFCGHHCRISTLEAGAKHLEVFISEAMFEIPFIASPIFDDHRVSLSHCHPVSSCSEFVVSAFIILISRIPYHSQVVARISADRGV
jgi:hypothetical protein